MERILETLNVADTPQRLDLPGYRLQQLRGSRAGTWSVTVQFNWRITFRFEAANAWDVNLEDYH
jgi:proteic killer suppression protein